MADTCYKLFRGILYSKGSTPLKWRDISILFLALFSTAMSITMLFPFLPAMVKHFGKTEEETGYYAGIIASSMFFGRFISSYFWGILADKIGRRPVIIISVICLAISTFLFGLSTSVAMAIVTRLLVGIGNGVIGISKAVISELCDATNQSLGMSIITSAFTSGLIIGPALGGFLSETGTKYPNTFPKGSFFARYPFLLPCVINSILHLISAITAYIWLPETLKERKKTNHKKGSLVNGCSLQQEKDKTCKCQEISEPERIKHISDNTIITPNQTLNILTENDTNIATNGRGTLNDDVVEDNTQLSVHEPQNSSKDGSVHNKEQPLSGVAELEDAGSITTNVTRDNSEPEPPESTCSIEHQSENIEQKSRGKSSNIELITDTEKSPAVRYRCANSTSKDHIETVEEDLEKESAERRRKIPCSRCSAGCKKDSNLWKILRNRDAVMMLVIYALFSFAAIGIDELVNLWAATSVPLGGLRFSTDNIGTFHLIIGIVMTVMQPTVLPKVERKIGCLLSLQLAIIIGMFFSIVTPACRIFFNRSKILWPILLLVLGLTRIAMCGGYLAIFLLINNSVNSELLCSINGLGMAVTSLCKSIGPTVGGSLFAWSITTGKIIGFPFNINFAFIAFGIIYVFSVFISCFVSESLNKPKNNDREILKKSVENLLKENT